VSRIVERERIDKLLVDLGLVDSRTRAQAMVMAGVVLVNEQRVEKPSEKFPTNAQIRIKRADDPTSRYVGRGGLKLEAALQTFQLNVDGLVCLDVGASTGGFTDCLLQHGARKVISVDVGYNQIDWSLRQDDRVEVREGINARYLQREDFPCEFDLVVMDVSFISATKVLPAIVPLVKLDGRLIVLIKPQFEVGKGEVGSGGIVRDAEKRERAIETVNQSASELGLLKVGVIESPIQGAEGNVEFLALYQREIANEKCQMTNDK
jgi:23S rRNA (cytidine1920-2'-O)/16S rRNA (cytidine1409-2'-O)-methyltransferase